MTNDNVAETREQARVIVEQIKKKAEADLKMIEEMRATLEKMMDSLTHQMMDTREALREMIEALVLPGEGEC